MSQRLTIDSIDDIGKVTPENYGIYYKNMLEIGQEYQDFVVHTLYKRGIVLVNYQSRKYQIKHGENIMGAEIKKDRNFRNTGNLYIEINEKSHPHVMNKTDSGVLREDNGWLYIIGDEKTIYIFSTRSLKKLCEYYLKAGRVRVAGARTGTSTGYLLPVALADEFYSLKIEIGEPEHE